jgi:hypothetical protein
MLAVYDSQLCKLLHFVQLSPHLIVFYTLQMDDMDNKGRALCDLTADLHVRSRTSHLADAKTVFKQINEVNQDRQPVSPEKSKFYRMFRHSSVDSDQKVPSDTDQNDDDNQSSENLASSRAVDDQGDGDSGTDEQTNDMGMNELLHMETDDGKLMSTSSDDFNFIEDLDLKNLPDQPGTSGLGACQALSQAKESKLRNLSATSSQEDTQSDESDTSDAASCYTKVQDMTGQAYGITCFQQGMFHLRGKSYVDARNWLEAAAALGNPRACFNLGLLHESGKGVKRISKSKVSEVFRILFS